MLQLQDASAVAAVQILAVRNSIVQFDAMWNKELHVYVSSWSWDLCQR
jgi:hypothetical protein